MNWIFILLCLTEWSRACSAMPTEYDDVLSLKIKTGLLIIIFPFTWINGLIVKYVWNFLHIKMHLPEINITEAYALMLLFIMLIPFSTVQRRPTK